MTLPMNQWLNPHRSDDRLIAWSESREWRQSEFRRDVLSLIDKLRAEPQLRWAVCLEDNYAFAVALLALLYSGKTPVLPGHFRQAVLAEQRDEFDALITDLPLELGCPILIYPCEAATFLSPLPEWPCNASLILFTSGSTGKPQKIIKPVASLERESLWLAALWGEDLEGAYFTATVAPHHMYGLTFAFMLPLSLGMPFYARSIEYHEQLQTLALVRSLVLISSPAFLKRLDPALKIARLRLVFSAGGPLHHEASALTAATCGCAPIEIYGTSETGVIAHRLPNAPWTLFDDIHFRRCADGHLALTSPLIPQADGIILSDDVEILPDQRQFNLLGRKDRIVKIAEQRISLNEIEQRLYGLVFVSEACALTLEKQGRVCVAVVLVLSEAGEEQRRKFGHNPFIGQLRQALRAWLCPVSIPRYWRIVPAIPLNQQGKRAAAELQELFL
ncbi:AMP-binding protein [Enterobacteriaceae bacterium Kacie_13]|nr:AMP-binding protein [Enterobacteriaceae bacterium Kacie_13]